jgi:hypothetical protein
MRTPTAVLSFTLAMFVAAAHADGNATFTAVTPIFSQVIALETPTQFRMVNEETKGGSYLQESVKSGDTVDRWSEMITVTGRQGAASLPQASAKSFVLNIFKNFQSACPATYSTLELGSRKVDGREGFAAIASCGSVSTAEEAAKNAAHSETALILGIKGSADIYTVQWAQRGQSSAHPLTLDAAVWVDRFKHLDPIRVCEHGPNQIQDCASRK